MPLAPSNARGYADYQRTGNYDTGVLYSSNIGTVNSDLTSGLIDMSRSAYVGGAVVCNGNPFKLNFTWTADAAGLFSMGFRSIVLAPTIPAQMQMRIPNLGAFLQVDIVRIGGLSQNVAIDVIGTDRFHPLEIIPINPVVVNLQGVAIPAGLGTFNPVDYYAGPLSVFCQSNGAASVNIALQKISTTGVWEYLAQGIGAVAPGTMNTFVAPAGAWRLVTNNSGAATTGFIVATPSTTGSV